MLFLQSYDFTVEYQLLKDNCPSRHPLEHNDEYMMSSPTTEGQVRFIINYGIPYAVSLEDIKGETELDPVLQKIISVIQSGKLREFLKDLDLKQYKLIATERSINDGVILFGNKVVVPESVQQQIIKLSHEGTLGHCVLKTACVIESVVPRDQQENLR